MTTKTERERAVEEEKKDESKVDPSEYSSRRINPPRVPNPVIAFA